MSSLAIAATIVSIGLLAQKAEWTKPSWRYEVTILTDGEIIITLFPSCLGLRPHTPCSFPGESELDEDLIDQITNTLQTRQMKLIVA
jgi:hypothetical protein